MYLVTIHDKEEQTVITEPFSTTEKADVFKKQFISTIDVSRFNARYSIQTKQTSMDYPDYPFVHAMNKLTLYKTAYDNLMNINIFDSLECINEFKKGLITYQECYNSLTKQQETNNV